MSFKIQLVRDLQQTLLLEAQRQPSNPISWPQEKKVRFGVLLAGLRLLSASLSETFSSLSPEQYFAKDNPGEEPFIEFVWPRIRAKELNEFEGRLGDLGVDCEVLWRYVRFCELLEALSYKNLVS